jgi:protein arginine kinase activator
MLKHECMACNQNPATVKLTKLIKGKVEEIFLCQDCAAQQSPYQKKSNPLSLDAILANILSQQQEEAAKPESIDLSCRSCGYPYDSYRASLLLGCSDCYESFEKYLQADLRKFHGDITHKGRKPVVQPEELPQEEPVPIQTTSVSELRRQMQDAVAAEDFELAARLRDEIKALGNQPENED